MKACGGVTHCNGRKIFVAFSNAKKRSVCHRANRTDDNSQLESSVDEGEHASVKFSSIDNCDTCYI